MKESPEERDAKGAQRTNERGAVARISPSVKESNSAMRRSSDRARKEPGFVGRCKARFSNLP